MFNQPQQQGHKSHLRFYIFMVTLVLGGLFFLLYANGHRDTSTGFVSAIVGYAGNATEKVTGQKEQQQDVGQELAQLANQGSKVNLYRTIPLSLTFNRIPTFEKNATVDDVNLEFNDLSTTVKVNGDKLELNNLREVKLSIHNFVGIVDLKSSEVSLSGTARGISINGIAFSSEKDVPISFQGLDYRYLQLNNIELKDLELPRGDGELKIGEKLQYSLENEELKMLYFKGSLTADKNSSSSPQLSMDGDVKGIYDNGDALTFMLH